MRNWMMILCLVPALSVADDPAVRAEFQAKYDAAFAALSSGNDRVYANLCGGNLVSADIHQRTQGLGPYLRSLEKPHGRISVRVESADTLDTAAKAAVRITTSWQTEETGKPVTYQSVRTEEDTWSLAGSDWKLDSVRLTSIVLIRNGKIMHQESEHVLTDWDRHYGRPTSSSLRRHHGRSGRRF